MTILPISQPDEPLTPVGRLFLQPDTEQIINCAIFFKSPVDIPTFKSALESSPLVQHPRFHSLLIRDRNGTEKWRKTGLNINQHIIIVNSNNNNNSSDSSCADDSKTTAEVNAYLADLSVSTPLSFDKPLWEVHVLVAYNCVVLRVHHTIGDGTSVMSLLSACFRRLDDSAMLLPTSRNPNSTANRTAKKRSILDVFKMVWFTIVFTLHVVGKLLWFRDVNVVSGGDGVQLWPRKMATARFSMDDMKMVKSAIPNATINDVLYGIVSIGLSRYLDLRTSKALLNGLQLTGMAMVNLRKASGVQELKNMMKAKSKARWGNKFAIVLLPFSYHKMGSDPLQLMSRIKVMLDRKKQSFEAQFSYLISNTLTSVFGVKVACWSTYQLICNTTFTISNMIGPKEEMTFAGNTITSLRLNTTCLPQALAMHLVSYAAKAEMQILTAKDIIPDPEVLAKCFEDALAEIKDAAAAIATGKLENC